MSKSFQNEIPQARVNITLDVDTGNSQSKKELPMKLLMLGDFSQSESQAPVGERERISINKTNFNQVMANLAPTASMAVPNRVGTEDEQIKVELTFKQFADFKPEQVVEQVPQLRKLIAMRNLLKDLKSSVIDNKAFRKALESIMQDATSAKALLEQMSAQAPIGQEDTSIN